MLIIEGRNKALMEYLRKQKWYFLGGGTILVGTGRREKQGEVVLIRSNVNDIHRLKCNEPICRLFHSYRIGCLQHRHVREQGKV